MNGEPIGIWLRHLWDSHLTPIWPAAILGRGAQTYFPISSRVASRRILRNSMRSRMDESDSTIAIVNLLDLNDHWKEALTRPTGWRPEPFVCGRYEPERDWFQVLLYESVHIHVPSTCKPLLRFINHACNCAWFVSLSSRLPTPIQERWLQASYYMNILRHKFFLEVVEKFYPEGVGLPVTTLPAPTRMTRQWVSSILVSWGYQVYHLQGMQPASGDRLEKLLEEHPNVSGSYGEHSFSCCLFRKSIVFQIGRIG